MNATDILAGLVFGAAGGAAHLLVTYKRARLLCNGRTGLSLLLLPLGFGAIALSVLLAAAISKTAAWFALPGILLSRGLLLGRSAHGT